MRKLRTLFLSFILIVFCCFTSFAAKGELAGLFKMDPADGTTNFYVTVPKASHYTRYSEVRVNIPAKKAYSGFYYAYLSYSKNITFYNPMSQVRVGSGTQDYWGWYNTDAAPKPGVILYYNTGEVNYGPKYKYIYINHPSHNIQTRSFTKGADLL